MKQALQNWFFFCLTIIIALTLGNWGNSETSIDGDKKQQVNFYGSLLTHQTDRPLPVDNISIGGKYKQIPMIEKPTATQNSTAAASSKTSRSEIALNVDPKTDLVTTKIDLNEVSALQVPNPHTIWTYQKENMYRKVEFLEVVVVSNNEQKTKAHYLLEARTKIYCNEVNDAGPIQKEVPLAAINILKIDGYKFRTMTPELGQSSATCPCEAQPPCAEKKSVAK